MKVIPNHIQKWRTMRGLTLADLAQALGTDKSQVYRLEQGQRRLTVEWLTRLSQALDCAPSDLIVHQHDAANSPPATRALPMSQRAINQAGALNCWQLQRTGRDYQLNDHPPLPLPSVWGGVSLSEHAYAIVVQDDDWSPAVRAGDVVVVDPDAHVAEGVEAIVFSSLQPLLLGVVREQTDSVMVLETGRSTGRVRVRVDSIQHQAAVVMVVRAATANRLIHQQNMATTRQP